MEPLTVISIFQYGTPFILLALVITNIITTLSIRQLIKEIEKIKSSITWKDTCDERHKELERRLNKLEHNL